MISLEGEYTQKRIAFASEIVGVPPYQINQILIYFIILYTFAIMTF